MSVNVLKFILRICLLVPFVTLVLSLSFEVVAQTTPAGDLIEIAFDIPDDINVKSFNVDGCSYVAPSSNGEELTLKCPLSKVYKVGFSRNGQSETETVYGILQIRPGLNGAVPSAGALHYVGTYLPDYDSGLQAYKDLPKDSQPLLLAGVPDVKAAPAAKVKIKEIEKPAAAKTVTPPPPPDVQVAAPLPVEPSPNASSIDLSWDASYGSIRVNGTTLIAETQEANGLFQGRMTLNDTIGNLFILSSDRNPNCNKSYTVEQLQEDQEVFFDCTEYNVSVPFKLPLVGNVCQRFGGTEISCLVGNRKKAFKVKIKGWKTVIIAVEEGVEVFDLPLSALQPDFPISTVIASLAEASADQCEPKQLELRVGAYCLNDICNDLSGGPRLIDQSGTLLGLAESGWDIGHLPTKVKLILIDVAGGAQTVLGEEIVPLDPVPVEAVSALIKKATGNVLVPLNIEVMGKIYKVGRSANFFTDKVCSTPISGSALDLSNPGNRIPDVPKCTFYRVFDGKQPRSECTPITYNKETQISSAVLQVKNCGTKRLLLYVAGNQSLNGRNSKAIVASLVKVANSMNDKEQCAPIDIVYTADEKRDILLTAEDMWFAASDSDLRGSFDLRFVNANSEILRDLEWVYRKWGDTLGGLIVIADGEKARPIDMTDSPASMAWKIKDVYRRVVNFSAAKNCDIFKDILLFEGCQQGEAGTFDAVLSEYIGQGLEALADNN